MSIVDVQRRPLTIDKVAECLGVTRRTVERKIRAGELPALQLGGKQTVIGDELVDWPSPRTLHHAAPNIGVNEAAGSEAVCFFESRRPDPAAVSISPSEAGRDVAS
jgi:excisionase family DNA binding protein